MSTYETGLDILGITGMARGQAAKISSDAAQAISRHKSGAQRLITTGQKIARKRPKLGNAFIRLGQANLKKADRASKTMAAAKRSVAPALKAPAAKMSTAPSRPAVRAALKPKTSARMSMVRGDIFGRVGIQPGQQGKPIDPSHLNYGDDPAAPTPPGTGKYEYSGPMITLENILVQDAIDNVAVTADAMVNALIPMQYQPAMADLFNEGDALLTSIQTALDDAASADTDSLPSSQWNAMNQSGQDWLSRASAGTTGQAATGLVVPWMPNTAYAAGAQVSSAGNLYGASAAGTSGNIAPSAAGTVRDGTVTWSYLGADLNAAQQPGGGAEGGGYGGSAGGGAGGGGSDEGGGGGGEEAAEAAPSGASDADEDARPPLDEDLAPPSEDPEDPFSDENPSEDDTDLLGVEFKWWHAFAPWAVADDVKQQKEEESRVNPGLDMGPKAPVAAQTVKVSPEVSAKLIAAQKRLAAARAQSTPPSGIDEGLSAAPVPSATLAERLAATKQFLSSVQGDTVAEDGSGVDWENLADLAIEAWRSTDITDEPADPNRRTASLHHGAGYLEELSYPRYGASAGQEGGIMFPRETIHVFGDDDGGDAYERGADVLGAGVPPKKPKVQPRLEFRNKTTPAGNKSVSLVPQKPRGGQHKQSIANARTVAKRAQSLGSKALSAAAKSASIAAKAAAAAKASAPGAKATAVHGLSAVHRAIGARHARKALGHAQVKLLAQRAIKAGKELTKQADTHQTHFDANTKKEKAAASVGRRMIPNKGTVISGDVDEAHMLLHGTVEEMLGDEAILLSEMEEMMGEDAPVSTPDAPAADAGVPTDGSVPLPADLKDPNAGQGPMPTLDTMEPFTNFTPDPKDGGANPVTGLPEGAIIFDPTGHPMTNKCVGSYGYFSGGKGEGFVWQGDSGKGHWNGSWGSWYGEIKDWGYDAGRREETPQSSAAAKWFQANNKWKGNGPDANAPASDVNAASNAAGWGPLIGNPADPVYKNLRYDAGGDQWFFYWDTAPDWAKTPSNTLRLTQAITDWKTAVTAAKTDQAAQAAQDQLDADQAKALAKQQAAEDVQIARQHDQEQKQAESDAAVQAKADEAAARQQQMADESRARQEAAQMELDIKAQQAQAEIDRAKQQQEYEQGERAYQVATAARAPGAAPGGEEAPAEGEGEVPTLEDGTPVFDEGDVGAESFDTGEYNLEEEATELSGSDRLRHRIIHEGL